MLKWHNFCTTVDIMNIEKINRKHYVETDLYYRVRLGLSSKILAFESGTIHLEVVIGKKWNKGYSATALEISNCWKETHPELQAAVGCKVYIIDAKKYSYKQHLIHSGIKPGYDAKKGILFNKNMLN